MTQQGGAMKKRAQNKTKIASFDLGSIVQVWLHDVDTTKADGKNLTLVVVEAVTKDDTSCPMYHLHVELVFLTYCTIQATWLQLNPLVKFLD